MPTCPDLWKKIIIIIKIRSAVERIADLKAGEEAGGVREERSPRGARGLVKVCGATSGAALGFPTSRTPRPARDGGDAFIPQETGGSVLHERRGCLGSGQRGCGVARPLPVPSRPAGGRAPRLRVPPPLPAAGLQALSSPRRVLVFSLPAHRRVQGSQPRGSFLYPFCFSFFSVSCRSPFLQVSVAGWQPVTFTNPFPLKCALRFLLGSFDGLFW